MVPEACGRITKRRCLSILASDKSAGDGILPHSRILLCAELTLNDRAFPKQQRIASPTRMRNNIHFDAIFELKSVQLHKFPALHYAKSCTEFEREERDDFCPGLSKPCYATSSFRTLALIHTLQVIFRNILSYDPVAKIWNDHTRTQYYLEFEAALAKAQASLHIIPSDAAAAIVEACSDISFIDWHLLEEQTRTIGYPVLGVVKQLVSKVNSSSPKGQTWGEWSHWGATTQDVTDTATIMQVRDSLEIIEQFLERILKALKKLAQDYKLTPMAARSNLQQAVPISAGFKFARLLATFLRHLDRLREARKRLLVLQFGGAAGTLATLCPDGGNDIGLRCQEELARELHLEVPDIAWHTERDRIAEFGFLCAMITGSCAKFALDLKLEMQTEVNEMREPYMPVSSDVCEYDV